VFNNVFDQLDTDKNGTVEFKEFMKNFGPAIAGEELPIMMDGEDRQTEKFQEIVRNREARAGCSTFNAEEARKMLSLKLVI
jgi:Ca2+-binding EF-hand superfamily protein